MGNGCVIDLEIAKHEILKRMTKVKYESIDDIVKDLEDNPVEATGNIYHRIPFPEFDHLKTSSDAEAVEHKWSVIEQACERLFDNNFSGMQVLDVGANGGLYTFSLAKRGAEVVSFELHPRYALVGQFLAETKQLPVTWHPMGFDPKIVEGKSFDVALMLSVYQWMCGGDGADEKSINELRFISQHCKYLFFELGFNQGKSCIKTTKMNHYGHLIRYLRRHSDYKNFRLLTKTSLWGGYKRFLVLCSNDSNQEDSLSRKLIRSLPV